MIDESRACRHLMDLLRIEGLSGREGKVAAAVREKLLAVGCEAAWIRHDAANRRIGQGFEIGNLIVRMPGTKRKPRRLFASHLDTVPLCRGAEPVRRGRRIVSKGHTALGADNRTAVACLITLAETLLRRDLAHAPATLLFTVGEEIGLLGAKAVESSALGNPRWGFNIDSGNPAEIIRGAIGAYRWTADVLGRSAHAGIHPDHGISAILIAARAVQDIAHRGYFGAVTKGRRRGTSNVGSIEGGEATNQVTDRVRLRGECRSHSPRFLETIVAQYEKSFHRAARSVRSSDGRHGEVRFEAERDYDAFSLSTRSDVVRFAVHTARSIGLSPVTSIVDGGLDANYLTQRGIPTVTIGAGQHHPHTVDEYVDLDEFYGGCRYAVALATA